jgi:hypothetical protein
VKSSDSTYSVAEGGMNTVVKNWDSINGGSFLDQLTDQQIFKKGSDTFNHGTVGYNKNEIITR